MPSVLTHYVFNKKVLDYNNQFLKGNEDIYFLGAQGPDPFFFYGLIPFLKSKNGKEIRGFGTRLHKMDPALAFEYFFEYANDSENKDVLYSYILGAGLHYILDRRVHPYVFYKTGFSDNPKMKKKYFVDHTLFETNMDVLLLNDKYKDFKTESFNSIKTDINKVRIVSDMYNYLANKLSDKNILKDSFLDSYNHMLMIEKVLYSRKGIKKWFASHFVKNTPINTMMHPSKVKDDEKIDYLNIHNNEWCDPATGKSSVLSVYDLFEVANDESREWFDIVRLAYNNKIDEERLKIFSGGFIYDGYTTDLKMKVFKSVYRKSEGEV